MLAGNDGEYSVVVDGFTVGGGLTRDVAVHVFDAQIRAKIAALSADRIFVHAGVVTHNEHAIVLPGPSFSGKSTLVAALVRAGATYYSDEFAVLDPDGLIEPYPRLISLREAGGRWGEYAPPESLSNRVSGPPVRAALIVDTTYVPAARWSARRCGPGEGALALLVNAVLERKSIAEAMEVIGRAVSSAATLKGERGEAEETAAILIDQLDELGS